MCAARFPLYVVFFIYLFIDLVAPTNMTDVTSIIGPIDNAIVDNILKLEK